MIDENADLPKENEDDEDIWDFVAYNAMFDRRMGACGPELLVATERLLDPQVYGLTEEQAKADVQEIIENIRYGYDREWTPTKNFWCQPGRIVAQDNDLPNP